MKRYFLATSALLCCLLQIHANEPVTGDIPTVYMVANAHHDTQWNWTVQQTIREFIPNTLYQNFALMDKYPEYVFNYEGAVKYSWVKEYYPDAFEKLKAYVTSGQWHPSGSSWDANDPNIPSIESAIRNILYGQEFYKKEFGRKSTDIMLPDCFGFGYTLPTVAAHCGLIGFGTQKLQWRYKPFYDKDRKVPFDFGIWEGIDGSRIMAVMDGSNYTWNPETPITDMKEIKDKISRSGVGAAYFYYGTKSSRLHGDQGGSPLPVSVRVIDQARQHPESYKVRFAATDDIFKDFDFSPELPVFNGELPMDVHATGCYTSKAWMKKLNRRNEYLLGAAEAASVMAECFSGLEYPAYAIDEGWKRILWHQFHDDITGTSIPEAYVFSYNDELVTANQMENVIRNAVLSVASELDTRTKGTPVVVFNPAGVSHSGTVSVMVDLPAGRQVSVYARKGNRRVPSQIVSRNDGKAELLFASEMSPYSMEVFDIRTGNSSSGTSLKITDRTIENAIYRLKLDSNGDICSIVDKRCGREIVKKGESIGLRAFPDNKSLKWPAWEIIRDVMEKEPVKVADNVRVSIVDRGPLRATLKVEKSYGESSFVQLVSLTDGADDDRIDIVTDVDWHSEATLLKASFPMDFPSPEAAYDLGLGHICRGNNTDIKYEVIGHKWADMTDSDGSFGVTVMNDCKYGWDKPDDYTIRLTLLHTPATGTRYTVQNEQDLGHHTFTYSICAHAGALDGARADAVASALNQPKFAVLATKHGGKPGVSSMARSSNGSLPVKAVKKAQDGDGIIVRLYEQSGAGAQTEVEFPFEIMSAHECNGIEEEIGEASFAGRKLSVKAGAYQLKTYKVVLKDSGVQCKDSYEMLELPYDMNAISTDAFSAFGHMDKEWHSYAAEIIPDEFSFLGVPYSFGEPDYKNALSCSGQVIELPEGTKTVHLLAASSAGDRTVEFLSGNTPVECKVNAYTGNFGCVAWPGRYDGFLKDGEVAYFGTHRHDSRTRNEAYVNTYMYHIAIAVGDGVRKLTLPRDGETVIFAATVQK